MAPSEFPVELCALSSQGSSNGSRAQCPQQGWMCATCSLGPCTWSEPPNHRSWDEVMADDIGLTLAIVCGQCRIDFLGYGGTGFSRISTSSDWLGYLGRVARHMYVFRAEKLRKRSMRTSWCCMSGSFHLYHSIFASWSVYWPASWLDWAKSLYFQTKCSS